MQQVKIILYRLHIKYLIKITILKNEGLHNGNLSKYIMPQCHIAPIMSYTKMY